MEREALGALSDLASYERPKKMTLLAEELTVENGFLTPTLKVKRREVQTRLDAVIDRQVNRWRALIEWRCGTNTMLLSIRLPGKPTIRGIDMDKFRA